MNDNLLHKYLMEEAKIADWKYGEWVNKTKAVQNANS